MKDKIITYLFMMYLIFFLVMNIASKDKTLSSSEKRKLTINTGINIDNAISGNLYNKFDKYAIDQFVGRDFYRTIKANVAYKVFNNLDNNNLYVDNNNLFKMEYPYRPDLLDKTINKIKKIVDEQFDNNNVYYAIIPDKNYFSNDTHLKINYNDMYNKINQGFSMYEGINITNTLSINNYYLTDPHWKQETLNSTVYEIISKMKKDYIDINYTQNKLKNFGGSYYGQIAINTKKDMMIYLTDENILNASVYYLENDKLISVYNLSKYRGIDPYDIYLDGASSYIEIVNNNLQDKSELIIFRDSFGSSIAPLLIPYYNKITLIDLRYLSSSLLKDYVTFNKQDVLFLYSTLIYNTNILK